MTSIDSLTTARLWRLVLWWIGDDLHPVAAKDETGRLLAFATDEVAVAFAARFAAYGFRTLVYPVSASDCVDLLLHNGVPRESIEDRVTVVEAATIDENDAVG